MTIKEFFLKIRFETINVTTIVLKKKKKGRCFCMGDPAKAYVQLQLLNFLLEQSYVDTVYKL